MPEQPIIVGNAVLVLVDYQKGDGEELSRKNEVGIDIMPGGRERIARAEQILAAARAAAMPVVFFQEVHRPSGIDFGRELDGNEGVHCVDGQRATELVDSRCAPDARPATSSSTSSSAATPGFIGTEFEIVLRALKADTLILIGGLTDVCVHYTFADAHQRDFYVRVIGDCVRRIYRRAPRRVPRCHGVPAGGCRPQHGRHPGRLRGGFAANPSSDTR